MTERPILFNTEMVQAVLDGRKTVTRRVVKPQPPTKEEVRKISGSSFSLGVSPDYRPHPMGKQQCKVFGPVWAVRKLMEREPVWECPYGVPGDRLYLKETWAAGHGRTCIYKADHPNGLQSVKRWSSSNHMPRRHSRITLEVVSVRVERIRKISTLDCKAEGIVPFPADGPRELFDAFRELWDSINAKSGYGLDTNPFVWVVEFKRVEA